MPDTDTHPALLELEQARLMLLAFENEYRGLLQKFLQLQVAFQQQKTELERLQFNEAQIILAKREKAQETNPVDELKRAAKGGTGGKAGSGPAQQSG